jgi:myo-inositol-1(or 4)-monophosphatase
LISTQFRPEMKGVADVDAMERAAIAAARGAGDLLRAFWARDVQKKDAAFIEFKSATDLVTEADKKAEAHIMQTLRAACPAMRFLCEESGLSVEPSAGAAVGRWIVDPLDGTTSFAHGHPHFSVSIAFEDTSGYVVIGVVYGVTLDEMYVARRGRGASCNGKPLKVSATTELIKALIVTGFPTDR